MKGAKTASKSVYAARIFMAASSAVLSILTVLSVIQRTLGESYDDAFGLVLPCLVCLLFAVPEILVVGDGRTLGLCPILFGAETVKIAAFVPTLIFCNPWLWRAMFSGNGNGGFLSEVGIGVINWIFVIVAALSTLLTMTYYAVRWGVALHRKSHRNKQFREEGSFSPMDKEDRI